MNAPFEADYNDNTVIVVHLAGCRHRVGAGKPRKALQAETLPAALTEAEHQGMQPCTGTSLGDTVTASCITR